MRGGVESELDVEVFQVARRVDDCGRAVPRPAPERQGAVVGDWDNGESRGLVRVLGRRGIQERPPLEPR